MQMTRSLIDGVKMKMILSIIACIIVVIAMILYSSLAFGDSLVSKDASGIYAAQEGEQEDVGMRTRTGKHFSNGRKKRYGAGISPIHYDPDVFAETPNYIEIDLDINLTPGENWNAAMESNGYQVRFWQSREIAGKTVRYIAQFRRAGKWLAMAPLALAWENTAGDRELISKPVAGIIPVIDNSSYTVTWADCFGPGLHYRYNIRPDRFFKTVIVDNKTDLPAPTISGPGLKLTVVLGLSWHSQSKAANGFADSVVPDEMPNDTDVSAVDEELPNPPIFAYQDESFRDTFWLQKPKAWDSAEERHTIAVDWRLRRRGSRIFAALSVPASALNHVDTEYPVYIDADIAEEQVGANGDDCWKVFGGTPTWEPSDDWIGVGYNSAAFFQYSSGMIFRGIPLTQGVTIDSGSITVTGVTAQSSVNANSRIRAYDSDDYSDDFSTEAEFDAIFPSDVTTAETDWDSIASFVLNAEYTSPDIAAVIQEIVDRGGWSSGNDLVLFWDDYDDRSGKGVANLRYAWSYSGANAKAAKLNVGYTEAGAGKQVIMIQGN